MCTLFYIDKSYTYQGIGTKINAITKMSALLPITNPIITLTKPN